MIERGFILTYHGVLPDSLPTLGSKFHNVTPDEFDQQLDFLKSRADVIDIDDWIGRKDRRGAVAVTFDDGYLGTLTHALPVLEHHNVSGTFFLNGDFLRGGLFWRDVVRWMDTQQHVADFLDWMPQERRELYHLTIDNFVNRTKSPAIQTDRLMGLLDRWQQERGIKPPRYTALAEEIPDHPCAVYGNHTWSHTIMASLEPKTRRREITKSRDAVKALPLTKARYTEVMALPFGNHRACGKWAAADAAEAGHNAVLYASSSYEKMPSVKGAVVVDRLTAPTTKAKLVERVS